MESYCQVVLLWQTSVIIDFCITAEFLGNSLVQTNQTKQIKHFWIQIVQFDGQNKSLTK